MFHTSKGSQLAMKMWVDKLLCMGVYDILVYLCTCLQWIHLVTQVSSPKISPFFHMNNILDLGFVVYIPSICSPYHLGIGVLWKPSSAQEHAWGWKWCTLEAFLRVGWPTDYPEREEKSLFKTFWWLEEIMHQLIWQGFYLNWCKDFWTINRMTWSF